MAFFVAGDAGGMNHPAPPLRSLFMLSVLAMLLRRARRRRGGRLTD